MTKRKKTETINLINPELSLANAHGKIDYQMTNDYMFRAVLQSSPKALKGLISSVLHMNVNDIVSTEIQNPIVLGESISSKEFRLDINVVMNDNTHINLEMQIANKLNWQNRSLSYLCRSFDQLIRGNDYNEIKSVIHIGFLDYTLFNEQPEFCACYKFMNDKSHHIYNDNLTLYVIDLSKINLATEEDQQYHINYWASLFKATTWEEMKELATIDEYLKEATQEMRRLNANEEIRKRCLDRLEYYQDLKLHEDLVNKLKGEVKTLESVKESLKSDNDNLKTDNASLKSDNASLKSDNANLKSDNANLKSDNANLKSDNDNLKSDNELLKSQNQDKDILIKQLLEENRKLKEAQA